MEVILTVASRDDVKRRLRNDFKGKAQSARISFDSPDLMFQVMNASAGKSSA